MSDHHGHLDGGPLVLAHRGLHVFPTRPGSKHPMACCDTCGTQSAPCRDTDTPCPCWPAEPCHSHRAATCDPRVIAAWWTRWPRANWALACEPSGLLAIDLDVKASPVPGQRFLPAALGLDNLTATTGADLFAQVAHHLSGNTQLHTHVVATPSGGWHAIFTAPPGRYTSSTGRITPKTGRVSGLGWSIDVRASGGYILTPGARTAAGLYRSVRDLPPLPVPRWLDRWLTLTGHRPDTPPPTTPPTVQPPHARTHAPEPARGERAARYAAAALDGVCAEIAAMAPDSGRNTALSRAAYRMGGYLATGLLDHTSTETALITAATTAGLTPRAAAATVHSGLTAGLRTPYTPPTGDTQ